MSSTEKLLNALVLENIDRSFLSCAWSLGTLDPHHAENSSVFSHRTAAQTLTTTERTRGFTSQAGYMSLARTSLASSALPHLHVVGEHDANGTEIPEAANRNSILLCVPGTRLATQPGIRF